MGDWHHPLHYSAKAQAYTKRARAAEIAVFVELCLPELRDTARSCGYTLAVHGSLVRDLDVVAVPWTDRAISADELLQRLADACKDLTGWGNIHGKEWTEKPHGRVARTILASSDVHLDLSVTPRLGRPVAD